MQIVQKYYFNVYHESGTPLKNKRPFKNSNLLIIVVSVHLVAVSGEVAFLAAFEA